MNDVHFGTMVPQIKRTWDQARDAASLFESAGFESLWVNDHLYGPTSPQIPILEAWTQISALAAVTNKVELGTLVTPVGMRNPAHLGKVVATADHISGGRVIVGLGSGWMPREFTDFGMPFLEPKERLGQLREVVQLLQRMWDEDEDEVSFDGKYVQTENVVTLPKPTRRPKILIGGGGEKVTTVPHTHLTLPTPPPVLYSVASATFNTQSTPSMAQLGNNYTTLSQRHQPSTSSHIHRLSTTDTHLASYHRP